MCAINPKYKKRLVIDVYTVFPFEKDRFEELVLQRALEAETKFNSIPDLRWHIKETEQEAD